MVDKTAPRKRKGTRALVITLAITAALISSAIGLRGHYDRYLAQRLGGELDTATDDRVEALLSEIAALDEAGLPVLVEALASERTIVSQAAQRTLVEEVRTWEKLRPRDSSRRLAVLAETLAGHSPRFSPTSASDSADIARRILRWPLDDGAVDRSRVFADCETVIRAAADVRRQLAGSGVPSRYEYAAPLDKIGGDRSSEQDSTRRPDTGGPLATGVPLPGVSEVPGGGLPYHTPGKPETIPDDHKPGPDDTVALDSSTAAGRAIVQPRLLPIDPESSGPIPKFTGPTPSEHEPTRPMSFFNRRITTASDSEGRNSPPSDWSTADTFSLLGQLHGEDRQSRTLAQRELQRRGFAPAGFALADELFSPNPEVRRQLARRLPDIGFVDSTAWLLRLADDHDPDVRRTAISLIATTGDTKLVGRMERLARADPDPGVRRLADQIARQRQKIGN